jgi:hypothetical protein
MAIKIPRQLQRPEFRFVLLLPKDKIPFELDWQNNGYRFDDKKLLEHIENDRNYGVIGGYGNLIIIDIDDKELADKLSKKLNTFSVRTGSDGMHFYMISDWKENKVLKNKMGEIRANKYQVVGPGCIHPNGKKYTEECGDRIYEYDSKFILDLLSEYIDNDIIINRDENFEDINKQIKVDKNFIVEKILPRINEQTKQLIITPLEKESLKKLGIESRSERDIKVITHVLLKGFGSYIKSIFEHFPVGDKCREHTAPDKYIEFTIKNARSYSGVKNDSVVSFENDLENIPDKVLRHKINDYLKLVLNFNDKLIQSYFISTIAYRTKINKKDLLEKLELMKKDNIDKKPISMFEFLNVTLPEVEYYINPLIPKNALTLIGGKPGQFKSMFALTIAVSLRKGESFLNNFKITEKPKILYYDLENTPNIVWWRVKYLMNGLNIEKEMMKDFDIIYDFSRINIQKELELAKNYDVIFLDSYRRFLEGTENDSDITDRFFKEFLAPLRAMGKTIIILHHFKKAKLEEMSDEDIMDLFRGSGDIPAQFDLIYGMFKSDEIEDPASNNTMFSVSLVKVKNRLGLSIKPSITFTVRKDDNLKATLFSFDGYKRLDSPKERNESMIVEFLNKVKIADRKDICNFMLAKASSKEQTTDRYLKSMLKDGFIIQPKYGFYSLPNNQKITNDNQLSLKLIDEVLK